MAQNDPQVNFRCPAELKSQLEVAAKEAQRSLNAEIVARLWESLKKADEHLVLPADSETLKEAMKQAIIELGSLFPAATINLPQKR